MHPRHGKTASVVRMLAAATPPETLLTIPGTLVHRWPPEDD